MYVESDNSCRLTTGECCLWLFLAVTHVPNRSSEMCLMLQHLKGQLLIQCQSVIPILIGLHVVRHVGRNADVAAFSQSVSSVVLLLKWVHVMQHVGSDADVEANTKLKGLEEKLAAVGQNISLRVKVKEQDNSEDLDGEEDQEQQLEIDQHRVPQDNGQVMHQYGECCTDIDAIVCHLSHLCLCHYAVSLSQPCACALL